MLKIFLSLMVGLFLCIAIVGIGYIFLLLLTISQGLFYLTFLICVFVTAGIIYLTQEV